MALKPRVSVNTVPVGGVWLLKHPTSLYALDLVSIRHEAKIRSLDIIDAKFMYDVDPATICHTPPVLVLAEDYKEGCPAIFSNKAEQKAYEDSKNKAAPKKATAKKAAANTPEVKSEETLKA